MWMEWNQSVDEENVSAETEIALFRKYFFFFSKEISE